MSFLSPFLSSVFRHLLTYVGGYLTALGVAESVASQWITTSTDILVGLAIAALGQGLSFLDKKKGITDGKGRVQP